MSRLSKKGKRIRPSDNHLVFHSLLNYFVFTWLSVFVLFHFKFLKQAMFTKEKLIQHFITNYGLITFVLSTLVGLLVLIIFYRFRFDSYKSLTHRQKLTRMILENGWYETKQVEDFDIFNSTSKMKEKISYFPKMYYQMKEGLIHISVEITLGKYQDQLLKLENKLETGLFCELVDKELKDSYIEYTLLYDTIANRISIEDVIVQNGSMKLMSNVSWSFDSLPHMLIAGGTGGGKSVTRSQLKRLCTVA